MFEQLLNSHCNTITSLDYMTKKGIKSRGAKKREMQLPLVLTSIYMPLKLSLFI